MLNAAQAFRFDPILHRYTLDGVPLPSTTELIKWMNRYAGVPEEVLEHKRELGDAVHLATALHDQNVLDPTSIDDVVSPFLRAWIGFRHDTGFTPTFVETPIYSPKYLYVTTPDRAGHFGDKNRLCVLEIKTTATILPSCGPQTAAQKQALVESAVLTGFADRFTVRLCPDETPPYRLVRHKDPNDLSVFLSSLNMHNWRIRNGYK